MAQTQIVINVSGGLVQDIFCSDPAAQVIVVDWDTEGSSPDDPGLVTVRNGDGREQAAWVADRDVEPIAGLAGTDAEQAIRAAQLGHRLNYEDSP